MGSPAPTVEIALAGNPNSGKTTLFNLLTGLRMQTGNYTGTTVTRKTGQWQVAGRTVELIDLPGMYSLDAATKEEEVAAEVLHGNRSDVSQPDIVLVVMDATNLERNLFLFSQLTECDLPIVVILTMMDRAHREGIEIDVPVLSEALGCAVVPVIASEKKGLPELEQAVDDIFTFGTEEFPRPPQPSEEVKCGVGCQGCPFHGRFTWSESIVARVVRTRHTAPGHLTESLDDVLTHPFFGVVAFLGVMFLVFYAIFALATIPMDLIEAFFGVMSEWVEARVPEGDLQSFLIHGVIGGAGGVLVFLPQICLLFFLLSLLDDSGYLSRAAFVMDRVMKRVGLPGTAFVPLLSGHACAIPAIMSTRVISDARDRLATILVLPLTSCSARIPVYILMISLLFPNQPLRGAATLAGAYGLGILAALVMAFVFKKTILPGESQPLLLELPAYKRPGFRNAVFHTLEKGGVFLKQAGTVILLISIGIWLISTYPKTEVSEDLPPDRIDQIQLENSIAGRIGQIMEPAIRPLGYDWQIGIGILSSFAAREAIISGLSVVYGIGSEAEEDPGLLLDNLRAATRSDGTPVFTTATCMSLLVFYVLAMQCLPTQTVTKAETGSWKWAGFQLLYMSVLAYVAALVVYQGLNLLGVS